MIEVVGLNKTFGKKDTAFAALKNISFKIPDGKTLAIIGKSGSGKSTLMHVMSGLDHADNGQVMMDGVDILKMNRRQQDKFRAEQLGFIFQSFFVEANQSCYQNVMLPLEIAKVSGNKRSALVKKALEEVELSEKINEKARNLSGGQKQRLAIARAIVNKPRYIFADEPTGNLDSTTGEKVVNLLFALHRDLGASLIIVTHDVDLARRCDVIVNIVDGAIVSIKDSGNDRTTQTAANGTRLPAQGNSAQLRKGKIQ